MAQQKILEVLDGIKPANPMAFEVIAYKLGLSASVLEKNLDDMCQQRPAPIERTSIKRGGKEQYYYWPTGVVSHQKTEKPAEPKPQAAAISTAQASGARVNSPVSTSSIATSMADKAIVNMEKPTMTKPQAAPLAKSKIGIMLDLIIQGRVSYQALKEAANEASPRSFLQPYIDKKLIIVIDTENGREFELAPGVTKVDLMRRPLVKPEPAAKKTAAPKPVVKESLTTEPAPAPAPVTDDTALKSTLSDALCAGQFSITPDGEILILQNGFIQHQYSLETALRLKRFLNAIDLESLCA